MVGHIRRREARQGFYRRADVVELAGGGVNDPGHTAVNFGDVAEVR
jgi:hypothetical protein